MPDAIVVKDSPANDAEAYETLLQIADRRTLHIPPEILVRCVLALPGEWGWPVRRAALEAILRRVASIRTQEIAVVQEPRRGPWGRYVLGRADADGTLPYDVRLASSAPVRGSCDCADFLRGALGLCKHLLAVLEHLARKPRAFGQIMKTPIASSRGGEIVWDATSAPPASTDPLEALVLTPPQPNGHKAPAIPLTIASLFRATKTGHGSLKTTQGADPEARIRLVRSLEAHARKAHAAADPAARAVLAEERARLERVLRLRTAAPQIRQALGRAKRRLYPYQKEGIRRFLAEGRLVLADDMGLGKTTQAIVGAGALYDARVVRRGLLVVPASLKPQWEREWQAVSDAPLRLIEGGAGDRRSIYQSTPRGFLVTNYEQVVRDLDAVIAWAPDMVVLDEAQRIKNWATKTALTIKRLKPDFRLVLTGTPMENRLEELASIVEWVDDRALEPKWRLVPWHSTYADGKQEVIGARNLDLLRKRLAPVLLRRLRSEVLSQLPARQDTVIPVELTAEQREAHDDLNQPIAKLARIVQRRPLTQGEFLKLMALLLTQRVIANGMAQLNFLSTWPEIRDRPPEPKLIESLAAPKLIEFRELISNLVVTQKRKVVVFSQFRRMLELAAWAVSDLLSAAGGLRALFFTGQEGARRRTQNLVDFHDDPQAAVLFLTDAGGVGLNLQKAANACINLELPWNPAVLEQRIGRIHRLGQKRPIDVYNLVSRACIEERIAGLVAGKRALFKGLFDGTTDQVQFDRSGALGAVLERLVAVPTAGQAPFSVETEAEEQPSVDAAASAPSDEVEPGMVFADDDVVAQPPQASSNPTGKGPEGTPLLPTAVGDAGESVEHLLGALTVRRSADGGVRIEAPLHAAHALMSLFEGMARLLGAATEPTATIPTPTENIARPVDAFYPITASTGSQTGGL
jgi:superfamily II DNA or RNA helicase